MLQQRLAQALARAVQHDKKTADRDGQVLADMRRVMAPALAHDKCVGMNLRQPCQLSVQHSDELLIHRATHWVSNAVNFTPLLLLLTALDADALFGGFTAG
jgi:hypothetical protein